MITIENSKFKAGIAERGAELQSLVNKADNYEYVWTGDKTFGIGMRLFCSHLSENQIRTNIV